MQIRPGIEIASQSDVGCRRENNEDFAFYWEPESDGDFRRKGRLAIIADGMGGYEGGQEASHLAVETILDVYEREGADGPRAALLKGFQSAHDRIRQYAEEHPEFQGMGTTCTALVVREHDMFYAHVGDSRLYLVRNDSIARLTHDHSYVGRLVDSGILRAEEAESHPQRHILTAALGAGLEISADAPDEPFRLQAGDNLVLCTDGLWSLVDEREMLRVIAGQPPAVACSELVELARARGGPDNITLEVLRVSPNGRP